MDILTTKIVNICENLYLDQCFQNILNQGRVVKNTRVCHHKLKNSLHLSGC